MKRFLLLFVAGLGLQFNGDLHSMKRKRSDDGAEERKYSREARSLIKVGEEDYRDEDYQPTNKKRKLNENVSDDDSQNTSQIIFDDFHDTVLMDIKPTQNATVTQDDDPQPIPDEVLARIDKSTEAQARLRDRAQLIWTDVNPIVEDSEEEDEEEVLPSNTNSSPNFSTNQKSTQRSSGGRFGIRQGRSYSAPRVQQGSNFDDTKKIRKSVMKRVQPVIDFFRGKKKKQEETVEEQEDDEDYQEDGDGIEDQESSSLQNSEEEEEEFEDEEEVREKQRKEEQARKEQEEKEREKKRKEKTRKEHQNINNKLRKKKRKRIQKKKHQNINNQLHEQRNRRLREIQKEQKKIRKNLSGNSQRPASPDIDSAEELQAEYDRRLMGNFRRQERRDVSRGMSPKDAAFKKVALMDNVRHMRKFGKPSPAMRRVAKKPKKRRGPSREQIRRRQQEAQRREQYRRRQEEIQRARRNTLAQLQAVRAAMVRDYLDDQYAREFHNSNQERRRANDIWRDLFNHFPTSMYDPRGNLRFCLTFPCDLILNLDEDVQRKIYQKCLDLLDKAKRKGFLWDHEKWLLHNVSDYYIDTLEIKFDADERRRANRLCSEGLDNFPGTFCSNKAFAYLIDLPDDAIPFLKRSLQKRMSKRFIKIAKKGLYSRSYAERKFFESFRNSPLNDLYEEAKAEEKLEELEREKRRLREEERQWENSLNDSSESEEDDEEEEILPPPPPPTKSKKVTFIDLTLDSSDDEEEEEVEEDEGGNGHYETTMKYLNETSELTNSLLEQTDKFANSRTIVPPPGVTHQRVTSRQNSRPRRQQRSSRRKRKKAPSKASINEALRQAQDERDEDEDDDDSVDSRGPNNVGGIIQEIPTKEEILQDITRIDQTAKTFADTLSNNPRCFGRLSAQAKEYADLVYSSTHNNLKIAAEFNNFDNQEAAHCMVQYSSKLFAIQKRTVCVLSWMGRGVVQGSEQLRQTAHELAMNPDKFLLETTDQLFQAGRLLTSAFCTWMTDPVKTSDFLIRLVNSIEEKFRNTSTEQKFVEGTAFLTNFIASVFVSGRGAQAVAKYTSMINQTVSLATREAGLLQKVKNSAGSFLSSHPSVNNFLTPMCYISQRIFDKAKECVQRGKSFVNELRNLFRRGGNRVKERTLISISEKSKHHIFRRAEGHFKSDTPKARKLLLDVANNEKNFLTVDKHGQAWYAKITDDGKQIWAQVRNGEIRNGGINDIPKACNPETGLSRSSRKK